MTKIIHKLVDYFYIFIIAFIWAVAIVSILFMSYHRQSKKFDYSDDNIITLEMAYKASINKYSFLARYIFRHSINNEEILSIFQKGTKAKGSLKKVYRQQLYEKLNPLYEKLKAEGIGQLQFITKDNISYIRFHKLSKSGDDLSKYRETIKIANRDNRIVSGFEAGRIVTGFRNVFPLNYQNKHLGCVEIGVTTKAIIGAISQLDPRREYSFILRKDVVFPKLLEEEKPFYKTSTIDSDFVFEDYAKISPKSVKIQSKTTNRINEKLMEDKKLHAALEQGRKFFKFAKVDNTFYDVSFVPMLGVNADVEGYLVAYKKSENIPIILSNFSLIVGIIISLMLILTILVLLLKSNYHTIQYQKRWFKSINDSLGEGIYVMDINANITYVNPLACEILGYSKDELIGKNAHYIFHSHYLNNNVSLRDCPILKGVSENMKLISEKEYFTCKDGHIIPVQINSRPTLKNGKILEIVTAFNDISEKRKLEEKNDLLLKALEVSSDTVMITDLDATVQWVNPAFEKLTGYGIKEIIGKNPKDLINSGKQTKEFYESMWNTILDKKTWNGELINRRKDGSLYYEELTITPIFDVHDNIKHFVAIKQDISKRKKIESSLQHVALHDVLTGLPNRRFLILHLEKVISGMIEFDKFIAILFLDLDGFKTLNDNNGHDAGDELLVQVSQRLQESIRKQDLVARLGGDEFVIVLDGLSNDLQKATVNAKEIAEKIRQNIALPFKLKKVTYEITASIGICLFNDNTKDVNERLEEADNALYNSKENGKNIISIFDD
ncbi:MAG: diguanylate cyclase [Sulfurospirillaceae bacterium]|nr:diguanylate cyclase [Sulfurospirillaceae bacterium]